MGRKPKQTFLQRRQMVFYKKYSTLLIIREMHIKTTIRYHLIPVRIAIIKKFTNNTCWRGHRKKDSSSTVGGNVNWYSLYGASLKNGK